MLSVVSVDTQWLVEQKSWDGRSATKCPMSSTSCNKTLLKQKVAKCCQYLVPNYITYITMGG